MLFDFIFFKKWLNKQHKLQIHQIQKKNQAENQNHTRT